MSNKSDKPKENRQKTNASCSEHTKITPIDINTSLQAAVFDIIESAHDQEEHPEQLELYDALPKYVWDARPESESTKNAVITRQYKIRGVEYKINIKPALLTRPDGTSFYAYPGSREEIIEDALRKIAAEGEAIEVEGQRGVTFTLYELQKELIRTGHGYNINEIKEAIMICSDSRLEIIGPNKKDAILSTLFPLVGLTTRESMKTDDMRCFVQFHPLVNESINNLTFRQYNYRISMGFSSLLARYMFKRMSHYWTQAHSQMPYTPSLISFLSQSPRPLSQLMSSNIRAMKNALEELIQKNVVSCYNATEEKQGKKILDVEYEIFPHKDFIFETIKSNKRQKDIGAAIEFQHDDDTGNKLNTTEIAGKDNNPI